MSEAAKIEGRRGARTGAGYTIPAAAEAIGCAYKTLLSAALRGQVQVIEFGGLRRVPAAEVTRLKALFHDLGGEVA